ncbi:cyclin-like protein [Saccharata proteae CBS 121410]|uniref:RNA polymerase II holoenzyme cyclin-like subunit n=1 Tax=Saccharata proteae CBS 121410 TaxID=1314787 RepID=A0A9P4HNM9_9PEZI|nr:cyclin-like protein [Saccharata proteae CBS 121410]
MAQFSGYKPASPRVVRERPKPPNDVVLQAEQQWMFTEEELLHTPSIEDGMTPEAEREMRFKGTNFIWQVGAMLKLPQLTLTTAAVFLNRFITRRSLVSREGYKALHHYQIAATSLFLATKVEENCRKMKELVIACCRVAQKNPNLLVDEQTKDFWRWRDTILYNEDVLLETICFDLTVEAPHKLFFEMMCYLGVEHNKRLRNAGWSFINDSNLTQLCLLVPSRTIAAAALYCGARLCGVSFADEDGKPWWEIQHVRLRDIRRACNYMAGIYEHVPPKEGQESIYVGLRTPEDGDPLFAETRLRTEQTPTSPAPSSLGGVMERSGSEQGDLSEEGEVEE